MSQSHIIKLCCYATQYKSTLKWARFLCFQSACTIPWISAEKSAFVIPWISVERKCVCHTCFLAQKGGMISRCVKSFLMHYQLFWRLLLKDKTVTPVESDNYFRQAITWELVKGSDATNVWKKGAKTVFLQKRYWRASVTGKRLTETLSKKLGANSKTASEEIAWATATRLWEK